MLDLLGTFETAELPNGDRLIAAYGQLDERVADELREALLALAAGDRRLILDLGDAHFMDLHTLAIVACAAQILRRRDTTFPIVTRSPRFRRLVEDSGIADLLELHPSLAEAMQAD